MEKDTPSPLKASRRRFLQSASSASAAIIGFPSILRSASPNSNLQVACIGIGGMGAATMRNVASHPKVKITSLCDIDRNLLEKTRTANPEASTHLDWRELLSDHLDRFDAVTVATPDHSHIGPALTAVGAGKSIYLQKPMAQTPHECRVLTRKAADAEVVTQLGNQKRSSVEDRMTVELLRRGVIGGIKEIIMWENKKLNWWPKNTSVQGGGDPVPEGFEWDLWLGSRESRPWFPDTYHPMSWRAWFDFGVGELGDMGCHYFDTSIDALSLGAPLKVRQLEAGSTGPLWAKGNRVEFLFQGNDHTAGDTIKVTWHDCDIRPDAGVVPLPEGVEELPESGTCWIGEEGSIFKNFRKGNPVVLRESGFPQEDYPSDIPPQNHYHEWVDCIFEGKKASSDFSHGGPLSETVLVGAMADRFPKQWLEWDSEKQRFSNCPEADEIIRRDYRDGWRMDDLA